MVERKTYNPPAGEVAVDLITSQCGSCGARVTTRQQHAHNLAALAARKSAYGELLTGEEIVSLRKKYGMTQQQAGEIFGKSNITFSRYENESTYPDLSTTRLMRMAVNPAYMRQLAKAAKVQLPLLEKRLSEELMRAVQQFVAAGKLAEGGTLNTKTRTTAIKTSVDLDRLFAAFSKSVQALTYPSTTNTGDDAAAISAANDERFALAA